MTDIHIEVNEHEAELIEMALSDLVITIEDWLDKYENPGSFYNQNTIDILEDIKREVKAALYAE